MIYSTTNFYMSDDTIYIAAWLIGSDTTTTATRWHSYDEEDEQNTTSFVTLLPGAK